MEIDIRHVPQRETGMTPDEIMLSESQERMLLAVKRGREAEVERIFDKWDLHASRIGVVTDDGLMRGEEPRRGGGRDPEHCARWQRADLRPSDSTAGISGRGRPARSGGRR